MEHILFCFSNQYNTTITFLGAIGIILGGAYSLWLFNRIAFGNLKTQYTNKFLDLNPREFLVLVPLMIGTVRDEVMISNIFSVINNKILTNITKYFSFESFKILNLI